MFDLFYVYRVIWRHKAAVDLRNIFDITPDKYYIKSISFSIAPSTIVYVSKFRFETRCPKVRNQFFLSFIYYFRSSFSDYAEISVTIIYVFTTKIPLSYGPWKFTGLPGLVMEAETEEGDYHWTVTGIEKPKTVTPIYFLDRNYVKTSRENTRKQERLLLKDPAGYLESYGYNFTTTNFNGQVVKLTLFTFDNPLERE